MRRGAPRYTRGAPRAVMRDLLEEALNLQACPEILGGE